MTAPSLLAGARQEKRGNRYRGTHRGICLFRILPAAPSPHANPAWQQGRGLSPKLVLLPPALKPSWCHGGPRQVLPGGNVPKTLGRDSHVPIAGMLLQPRNIPKPDTGGGDWEKRRENTCPGSSCISTQHQHLPLKPWGLVLLPQMGVIHGVLGKQSPIPARRGTGCTQGRSLLFLG